MKLTNTISVMSLLIFMVLSLNAQPILFRNGVFLHHSTGGCIWGPNGSSTSIPQEMASYNSLHNYSGDNAITMQERGWPETPWNNEWERWHRIFNNEDTIDADIRPIIKDNSIIVIKSCFPSSDMSEYGSASDTLNPESKTMYNYKWHWRNFIRVMGYHPENFFAVWTNAPLVAGATNNDAAQLSNEFCTWARDTLAMGLDEVFGPFPPNVYVFDFFHKLVGEDGKLKAQYAASSGDSHPNGDATAYLAPQFVQEIFDAAIAYENLITSVHSRIKNYPKASQLFQNYPNPFNPTTSIDFVIQNSGFTSLKVYDMLGREIVTLVDATMESGVHSVRFEGSKLTSGIYIYTLRSGSFITSKKMMLLK